MAEKEFVPDVILKLSETEPNRFGSRSAVQLCRWIVDGKVNKAKLEKREWYLDKSGNERNKAIGFTEADFDLCILAKDRIKAAWANPPEYVPPVKTAEQEAKEIADAAEDF